MKLFYFVIFTILLSSCSRDKNTSLKIGRNKANHIVNSEIQSVIDSSEVVGSVLIYDFQNGTYYSNNFNWAKKGKLPASTFKIVNSIIALETGIVKDASTIFKWDGNKRWLKQWEQDLSLRDAFHYSCVPCFQDVARNIGEKRMNEYLNILEYDNMKIDSNSVDLFWLEGDSRISQFQQIDFLKRFYESKLPISRRTEVIMKRMMVIEDNDNYRLSGKTGWSNSTGTDNGWFVGYVELGIETYFFATNIEPKEKCNMDKFPMIRKTITFEAFNKLDIIINKTNY